MPSIIEQIAKDLNVSNASVSRALNDRPGVGAKLRERILQRARELNYTPSVTARGLATSQTFGIGFFVREKPGLSTQTDPFYGEILHGVEQVTSQSDYHVTIGTLTEDVLSNPSDFRFVRERRIDGMILAGPDIPNDFIVAMLQSGLPVVLADNRLNHSSIDAVTSDDEGGGYMAAAHLIEQGHRDIGIITGPKHWTSNARRVSGYTRALLEADLPIRIVHAQHTSIDTGSTAYQEIIAKYPELTAFCAVNDSMAIGALRAARANGKSVPDDLSIVGFDDISWSRLHEPPLTTIRIPKNQMGKEAANRLMTLLDDSQLRPIEITVSVQFIQRATTSTI